MASTSPSRDAAHTSGMTTLRRRDLGAGPTATATGATLSSGAFAAHKRDPDEVTLIDAADPACFTGLDPNLPADVRVLGDVLAVVHAATTNRHAMWVAQETYTCDGGALATKLAAEQLGIDATIYVGLYWHTDAAVRADVIGYDRSDYTDDEWEDVLAETRQMMDEHHHWATVRSANGAEYLIDPNGPARGEPHILPLEGTGDRYREGAPFYAYDPEEDPTLVADEMYPGLREHITAAVQTSPHTTQA
jgi:hypothetical protein